MSQYLRESAVANIEKYLEGECKPEELREILKKGIADSESELK